jgi:hypothetical protein
MARARYLPVVIGRRCRVAWGSRPLNGRVRSCAGWPTPPVGMRRGSFRPRAPGGRSGGFRRPQGSTARGSRRPASDSCVPATNCGRPGPLLSGGRVAARVRWRRGDGFCAQDGCPDPTVRAQRRTSTVTRETGCPVNRRRRSLGNRQSGGGSDPSRCHPTFPALVLRCSANPARGFVSRSWKTAFQATSGAPPHRPARGSPARGNVTAPRRRQIQMRRGSPAAHSPIH